MIPKMIFCRIMITFAAPPSNGKLIVKRKRRAVRSFRCWALVKPEIRISEKVTCALVGGANYTLTTFLISFLNFLRFNRIK